jgi:hypothetical protein
MDVNPMLLSPTALAVADNHQILVSLYQYIVASVSFLLTLVFFYFLFRFLVWFLPSYWHRGTEK